jgi:hypothetical protein
LADGMETLARDASLRRRLSGGIQSLADKEFSWRQVKKRTLEVLKGT